MKDKKILVICGPTATGKTNLALHLAKEFKGEILSADSRQVYKGMDIGTGKDLRENSKFEVLNPKVGGAYRVDGVLLWGYDLVAPKREFSVEHYRKIAFKILKSIWERGNLPMITGGTGLYIKSLVDGIATSSIPKNKKIRKILQDKSTPELYEMLARLDALKAASMNSSDSKNPRRLVRAVEIAQYLGLKKQLSLETMNLTDDVLRVGLHLPLDILKGNIEKRVHKRIKMGFEGEVKKLLDSGVDWKYQSMKSLGYRQWSGYLNGTLSRQETIDKWIREEIKYARRQMTWFKKDKRITWFDVSKAGFKKEVEKSVGKWYSS